MKRPLLVAALGVFCWLVFGANPSSWAVQKPTESAEERALSDKVQALHRGAQITVFTRAGVKIEGTLREVQADAIVIDNKKGADRRPSSSPTSKSSRPKEKDARPKCS